MIITAALRQRSLLRKPLIIFARSLRGVPGVECYENCETGWDHYIKESLFKLLTEKKGLPEKRKK